MEKDEAYLMAYLKDIEINPRVNFDSQNKISQLAPFIMHLVYIYKSGSDQGHLLGRFGAKMLILQA